MKSQSHSTVNRNGFTLPEVTIAVGVLGLLGIVFFQVLQSGLTLSAKNTAVNAAHEEARQGILRMTRDIHASISVPQLRDSSFAVVSSTPAPNAAAGATPPTAAGVSFQNIAYGPNFIWRDPSPSGNSPIMIKDGADVPEAGMRLIVPFWGIEDTVTKVTAASSPAHSNIWTASGQEQVLGNKTPIFGGSTYAITYYTNRIMYLVKNGNYVADSKGDFTFSGGVYTQVTPGTGQYRYENGELHYYIQRYTNNATYWQDKATVARYLSTPKPFSVPLNRYGSSDNKYVAVAISARDPKSSNRGFIATASLLNTQIDYRSRLTIYQ
jgi:prepilin-type N-terminal cleavage/methylation domain-containing protein